jgi:hypothetical protein
MSKRVQVGLIAVVCFLLGWIGAQQLPFAQAQEAKRPSWLHGLDLKARKGGEKDFTKDTKVYGIEVFKDENNGNLIYISETGSIAVVPAK